MASKAHLKHGEVPAQSGIRTLLVQPLCAVCRHIVPGLGRQRAADLEVVSDQVVEALCQAVVGAQANVLYSSQADEGLEEAGPLEMTPRPRGSGSITVMRSERGGKNGSALLGADRGSGEQHYTSDYQKMVRPSRRGHGQTQHALPACNSLGQPFAARISDGHDLQQVLPLVLTDGQAAGEPPSP